MQNTILGANSVNNAKNFRANQANLYFYLGGADPWPNESVPPLYTTDTNDKVSTRNNIEYLENVLSTNSCLAIPRIDWEINTVYPQYSATSTSGSIYVMNDNNEVYKCISNNNGTQSTSPPIGTGTTVVLLADGYQWKFMYDLSPLAASVFLTQNYIPLPTDSSLITANSLAVITHAQYTVGDPPGGHGSNPAVELGAKYVIIAKTFQFSSIFTGDFQHRQFGLFSQPTDMEGNLLADFNYIIDSNSDVNLMSGQLLTISNHTLIDSSIDNSEIAQIVLSF